MLLSCCKFLCSVKPCLQLHNFKRHLAQLIGDPDDSVAAEEDVIISRVKNISRDYRDVKAVSVVKKCNPMKQGVEKVRILTF